MELNSLLPKTSYSPIVQEIYEKIKNVDCDTAMGNEICAKTFKILNESNTPIIELKQFKTDAEQLAKNDTTLGELVKFITKKITTGDLNFIINLVKEDHFKNMTRTNHPAPEQTIKNIKDLFNEPASVIEEGIKAGLFDTLESDLLDKVKKDLNVTGPKKDGSKKLNESAIQLNHDVLRYSPVGVKFEDVDNNRLLLLTESAILGFDRKAAKEKTYQGLDCINESVDIPDAHKRLLTAINSCPYNPETQTFELFENWDFKLLLESDGKVMVSHDDKSKEIKKEDVKTLLLESVKLYNSVPGKVEKFNKINFIKDADNFVMLVENHANLVKFDNITMLKNLSENSFVMFENETVLKNFEPKILSSSDRSLNNKLFESYGLFTESINTVLSSEMKPLFESQLDNENKLLGFRNKKIVELTESQKEINANIEKVKSLVSLSENGSPAYDKLMNQQKELDSLLESNIKKLNHFKNEFTLYK